jgi:prephenate dehydrogenase
VSDATRVAIIGLGAIGGSAALKLIERGVRPVGFDASPADADAAAAAGIVVRSTTREAVADADLVLIAVPLDQVASVTAEVIAGVPSTTTILHAASLQRPDAVRLDGSFDRVIGTHPLAGSAESGFSAATPGMFRGATVFIEPRGSAREREDAELFWSMAGAARLEYLTADEHDRLMAAISHLPQLAATALAATLSAGGVDRARIGPGARDSTRLAVSNWSMWRPILGAAPARTAALLSAFETEIRTLRESIEGGDLTEAQLTWTVARDWALSSNRS